MIRLFRCLPSLLLLGGCVGSSVVPSPDRGLSPAALRPLAAAHCPKYRKGSGILADGDFSGSVDPGSTFWNFDRLCSVDLYGESAVGGIAHHPLQTVKGASYVLTFLMSGNDYCGTTTKIMKVAAGNKAVLFKWNASGGNSVENGKVSSRQGRERLRAGGRRRCGNEALMVGYSSNRSR
jgi:hypothetical protein